VAVLFFSGGFFCFAMGLEMNRLRHEVGGIANCAMGAKSVTEKTTWLVWVGGAAKRQRSP
jgi:hypothetical protein